MRSDVLIDPVQRFVDDLAPALEHIATVVSGMVGDDVRTVTTEAFNVTCACIDMDGLHTDEEIWALIAAFGPRIDTMLHRATPGDVRKAGILTGKRAFLDGPSILFEVLVRGDQRLSTSYAWRYYQHAVGIAHAIASLDAVPSRQELSAIDRFRTMLLRSLDLAGLPHGERKPGHGPVGRPGAGAQPETDQPPGPRSPDAADAEAPLPPPRPLEELLAELDSLVGLAPVKAEVKLVANLLKVQQLRKERGLPVTEASRHLVFTGNPGTGKTTVARLLSEIYRTLGVVDRGHLVETDRSGLVAGYVGQTAIQTRQVVESAIGGVLLIDEAYALARGEAKDFGREAIDTLVKLMEDHRDDLVIIAAGYPEEMQVFIESNPGLRSRFPKVIHFPDYSTEEIVAIFELMGKKSAYSLTEPAREQLVAWLDTQPRDRGFGNARLARNLLEAAVARHASRVVGIEDPTDEQLCTIEPDDLDLPSPAAAAP